ncbi:MAG TPA: NAD(P)-dependent alcohol dehydrogenase [Casimicrobiaceae bacterium]|nr:NAD(P)-dependent alcohol dehydrogenase [Casimicrobiaceae bacterium]
MRAVRYARFGRSDVLEVVEVDKPVPAAGELLVEVRAASLNPLDWKIRAGHLRLVPMFKRPPRGVGVDFAGIVVAVGGGAGPRHVGERVFGSLSPFGRTGSCAEFITIRASRVTPIPSPLSDEVAAALPVAAGTALQALADDAKLGAGQRVLITGAGGGVGHFAVQVAKHLGAQVSATCGPANVEFVRSLGADQVLDYTQPDALSRLGAPLDVVFDVAESIGWRGARGLLTRNGCYIGTGGSAATAISTTVASAIAPLVGIRAQTYVLRTGPALDERLARLAVDGVLVPHIAQRIGLDGVAKAQASMETGHGRGKIVVTPASAPPV